MTGKLTTISGTKRGRDDIHEEHSVQEVGGGPGGSAALAVASGSADDANAGHHRNGGPFEIWNGGSASTAATGAGRGDGIDPLLNLASPNTLEGGRGGGGGGDENGGGTMEKVAGGTMFAATIKRRRRVERRRPPIVPAVTAAMLDLASSLLAATAMTPRSSSTPSGRPCTATTSSSDWRCRGGRG